MSTEIAPSESSQQLVVQKEGGNVAVTALIPEHMADSQAALIAWAERKVKEVAADAVELRAAFQHAYSHKWKSGTLKNQAAKAEKREVFYRKILVALRHGYVIVPNFPVQMFAIRTKKDTPAWMSTTGWNRDFKQSAQVLPIGEGEYQNPFPLVTSRRVCDPKPNDPTNMATEYHTDVWDQLEFPISMAKPVIMEAASRAMALQLFDQIGVLPQNRREDPVIIGQLIDPRDQWKLRIVSFMIAWHLDTRVL